MKKAASSLAMVEKIIRVVTVRFTRSVEFASLKYAQLPAREIKIWRWFPVLPEVFGS